MTLPSAPSNNDAPWGLVLGGGGSRTFLHLGVLQALEDAGLHPAFVGGSSLGAVFAALYASWPVDEPAPARQTAQRALDLFDRHPELGSRGRPEKTDHLHRRTGLFKRLRKSAAAFAIAGWTAFRPWLRSRHPIHPVIDELFGERTIESLRIPFACVALDLTYAREHRFVAGSLSTALKAGVAVGFLFRPLRVDDAWMVDAAPIAPVPVRACRPLGTGPILAVDVCTPVRPAPALDTGMEVAMRVIAASTSRLNAMERETAAFVLTPESDDVFWGDFSRGRELIERGRAAMAERLDDWCALLRPTS